MRLPAPALSPALSSILSRVMVLGLAALIGFASPTLAATDEIFQNIQALHGNAQDLDEPLLELQQSAKNGSAEAMADLIEYPISVRNNGEVYDIETREDFIADFADLVSPDTLKALARLKYSDLIVNSDGVGVANGAVWFSGICEDDACETAHWAIIAINN